MRTKKRVFRSFGRCTQQIASDRIQIKLSPIVFAAAGTGQHIGHVPGQRHGAQLIDHFQHPHRALLLAEHVQAVEQQPQLCFRFRRRRRKLGCNLGHIRGQPHAFHRGGNSMKHVFDLRGIDEIMAAAAGQAEL